MNTCRNVVLTIRNQYRMEFSNPVIVKEDLPQVEFVTYTNLEKSYAQLLKLESIFTVLIIGMVYGIGMLVFPIIGKYPLNILGIVGYILLAGSLLWLGFQSWHFKGYAIREHDLLYKTGIIFRNTTMISFNRVQHIEINQGPMDRWFKVVGITLYTAGGSGSDLSIPGLDPEDAARIKEWILKKTAGDGEEE